MLQVPTQADASKGSQRFSGLTYNELHKGYDLYVTNCGSCHRLHQPAEHTEQEWNKLLPEMASRAKLNEKDRVLIYKYLMTMLESSAAKGNQN